MILRELVTTEAYIGKTADEILTALNTAVVAEDGTIVTPSSAMANLGREATAADVADALATELEIEARAVRGTSADGVNWTFGDAATRDAAAAHFRAKGKTATNNGDAGLIVG